MSDTPLEAALALFLSLDAEMKADGYIAQSSPEWKELKSALDSLARKGASIPAEGMVVPQTCDCGAVSDGKWVGIHSKNCASITRTMTQEDADLVKQLRRGVDDGVDGWWFTMEQAADAIVRLSAAPSPAPAAPQDETENLTKWKVGDLLTIVWRVKAIEHGIPVWEQAPEMPQDEVV